ncbi:MAG TPA: lysine--tRNA ligase [Acidimicrobiales bacterium]|nr:lysine--tRNA ligase [Acidimicrobiales bacterium]
MTARVPYRFERTHSAAAIAAEFPGLAPGAETGTNVSVAGRLMLVRSQGKLVFATMADSSGRIQLFAAAADTPRFEELGRLSIGDWIGATGEVIATRRGELSVKVAEWVVLAETRRPFPDKWHGLTDPDTRYRQRYVDLWVSEEVRPTFVLRSRMLSLTRRWLEERAFLEVETPMFHSVTGGAKPFTTHHNALDVDLHLRIAPELFLKRLVVGGFERVFEIGRCFRNEGLSPRHQPEFTMLELYQAYGDYTDMMELSEGLVSWLAQECLGTTKLTYGGRPVDLTPPWRRATMVDLIEEHAGVRVDLRTPIDELRRAASDHGVAVKDEWGAGKLILELYEATTEAQLWDPTFVLDYPQEVSPLARTHREMPGVVERFEGIITGREMFNAFSELQDADDQRRRFEDQVAQRLAGDLEAMDIDEDYLRALDYGLPPTAGLGIGIDRLVMLFADQPHIRDVTLFPTMRPEQGLGGE